MKSYSPSSGGSPIGGGTSSVAWKWDTALIGTGIEVSPDKTKVFLREGPYMFRTCIGDTVRAYCKQSVVNHLELGIYWRSSLLGDSC